MCKRSASIIITGLALGGLLLAGSPAGAQGLAPPSIGQRQANQQQRVQKGIDSGTLTRGESRFLNREQGRIDRARERMQADSNLSPQEQQRLSRMQNQASDDIYRLKHNDRTVDGWSSDAYPAGGGGYSSLGGYPAMGGYPSFGGGGGSSNWGSNILSILSGAFSAFGGYPASGGGGYPAYGGGGCAAFGGGYPVWSVNSFSAYSVNTYPAWGGNAYSAWGGGRYPFWGGYAYDPRSERREAYQERLIRQGIESGELTRGEARYLNQEQARIDRAEDRMMADGRLSPMERQRLNQMQNQAGRDINRLEHNNRTADGHQGGGPGNHQRGDGNHGWQGNNPQHAGNHPGNPPGNNPNNRGWHGNGNSGWHGNNPQAGNHQGNPNNRGWHGNNPGGNGQAPGAPAPVAPGNNGTTTARNPQGPQGHYARQGQPGAYQQPPGARPAQPPAFQGRQPQQYQQARQPMPPRQPMQQPTMRPQPQMRPMPQAQPQMRAAMPQPAMRPNMMARQPNMGGMVNRANFGGAPRRR